MWHLFLPHNYKTGRTGTRNYPEFLEGMRKAGSKAASECSLDMHSDMYCAGGVVFTDDDYNKV